MREKIQINKIKNEKEKTATNTKGILGTTSKTYIQ
jgi:hypothetical protein